jgi:hypothetical protein
VVQQVKGSAGLVAGQPARGLQQAVQQVAEGCAAHGERQDFLQAARIARRRLRCGRSFGHGDCLLITDRMLRVF